MPRGYSITSSARMGSVNRISKPSVFAAQKFRSNLECVQESFRLLEILRVQPFREPAIDS